VNGRSFDIAIVGAGPAGSAAAIGLARRGYSVALLDKAKFPREKLCGDFINPSNWPLLEELGVARELYRHEHELVSRFRISAANGAAADAALPVQEGAPAHGLGMRRFWFDRLLLAQAEKCGATILTGCRVGALERFSDRWRVVYRRGEAVDECSARILLGADGRNSWVAHHLGMAGGAVESDRHIGFQLRLKSPGRQVGEIAIHLFPGGYAGVLGTGDGMATLGFAIERERLGERASLDQLLERQLGRNPSLSELLRRSEMTGRARAAYPVFFPPRQAVDDGVLLIGDAARVNEPVSGEGVYFALRSALIAADAADQAFAQSDFSAAALMACERRCRREFRLRRSLNGAMRYLIYRPALLAPMIRLFAKNRRPLESLVALICRPQSAV
jgi:geranylgeranyl reductase family protein